MGRELVDSLNRHSRARCGYATLHSVLDKSQEDRMESFFLSETCKYLYLVRPQSASGTDGGSACVCGVEMRSGVVSFIVLSPHVQTIICDYV